jgi:hypothetical protein
MTDTGEVRVGVGNVEDGTLRRGTGGRALVQGDDGRKVDPGKGVAGQSREMEETFSFLRRRPLHSKLVPWLPPPRHRAPTSDSSPPNPGDLSAVLNLKQEGNRGKEDPAMPSCLEEASDGAQTGSSCGMRQFRLSLPEVEAIFAELDEDEDGVITHGEFLETVRRKRHIGVKMGLGISSER